MSLRIKFKLWVGSMLAIIMATWFGVKCAVAAEWTPLITADTFAGIKSDIGTAAAGIISCVVIILGVGILVRALGR